MYKYINAKIRKSSWSSTTLHYYSVSSTSLCVHQAPLKNIDLSLRFEKYGRFVFRDVWSSCYLYDSILQLIHKYHRVCVIKVPDSVSYQFHIVNSQIIEL